MVLILNIHFFVNKNVELGLILIYKIPLIKYKKQNNNVREYLLYYYILKI